MFLKHVVHPGSYLHVSNSLVRLARLLQPARTGGSQTCRANEVSPEMKGRPVQILSDSLEALQRAERSLVLVTHNHSPVGSVQDSVVFLTLVQSFVLDLV